MIHHTFPSLLLRFSASPAAEHYRNDESNKHKTRFKKAHFQLAGLRRHVNSVSDRLEGLEEKMTKVAELAIIVAKRRSRQ
jgi:hypothetical protein